MVVFGVFPSKAETAQAKKIRNPAPRNGMMIVDLASGKSLEDRVSVRRFAMPEDATGGYLAYQKDGGAAADSADESAAGEMIAAISRRVAGRSGRGGAGGSRRRSASAVWHWSSPAHDRRWKRAHLQRRGGVFR